jgi:hypothetical protein
MPIIGSISRKNKPMKRTKDEAAIMPFKGRNPISVRRIGVGLVLQDNSGRIPHRPNHQMNSPTWNLTEQFHLFGVLSKMT